jgi:hypothetical protein
VEQTNEIGFPTWWHHHGTKMNLKLLDSRKEILVIAGSAAEITIRKATSVKRGWFIDWKVIQSIPSETGTSGRVWFSDDDLRCAFWLSVCSGKFGDWLIERYGADSAEQGKYIRRGIFLNIPCPGTGHDGDPNVSIMLDGKIKIAVYNLLNHV